METLAIFKSEDIGDEEAKSFHVRQATRGIVIDRDMNTVLMYVPGKNYYGLPGGGVEEGETHEQAFIRECMEEICCEVEILTPLGKTLEYKKAQGINESHGFIARVVGEKGEYIPTGDEAELGIVLKWVSIPEAIELITTNKESFSSNGKHAIERNEIFLKKAQEVLNK